MIERLLQQQQQEQRLRQRMKTIRKPYEIEIFESVTNQIHQFVQPR